MASGSIDSVNPSGAGASRRLGSILLDRQRACLTRCFGRGTNETTATTYAKADYSVTVSFWMAESPGISCFSVECYRLPGDFRPQGFTVQPHVVGADGRFVLLRARLCCKYDTVEYFMYKAGSGSGDGESPPSLESVPLPDDDDEGIALDRVSEFGVVPRDDDREHYLLAALCDDDPDSPADYHLRIYSSETKAWSTTRTLRNPCPGARKIVPDKVIALGDGSLAWVDLSCGLVACEVDLRQDQDPPVLRFIPLPEPLLGNRNRVEASLPNPGAAARSFRDLACFNGVLKLFEMERYMTENPTDEKDVVHDSDLITSLKRNGGVDDDEKKPKSRDCWRAVTWSRTVCSSSFWRKECTLSGDDILLDETKHSALVSRLRGGTKLTLSDLYLAFPTLSTDGDDDTLYLMSVAEPGDQSGWVLAVDLGNSTVKAAVACSFKEHAASNQAFRPCTLSRYLNLTPGTEVSAWCEKVRAVSSHKIRVKDFMRVHMRPLPSHRPLKPCQPRPPLPSIPLMAGKNKRARDEAHGITQNDHVSEDEPVQTNLALEQCDNTSGISPLNPE